MKFQCLYCSSYQIKKERYKKKYCSQICCWLSHYKICKCCYNEFFAKSLSHQYCNSCIISGAQKRKYYHETYRVEKNCSRCGKIFKDKAKVILCDDCKKLPHHEYKNTIKKVLCPYCGDVIKEWTVKDTKLTQKISYHKNKCYSCKQIEKNIYKKQKIQQKQERQQRQLLREQQKIQQKQERILKKAKKEALLTEDDKLRRYKKNENRRKWKEKCKNLTPDEIVILKEETKKNNIIRMKENNPMFNSKIKERVLKTRRERIEKGEIVYKTGTEHHLWKGNGDFNKICRDHLYKSWKKPILERDNFTCTVCGKGNCLLHIHHIRPLRKIIGGVLEKNGLKSVKNIDINSDKCFKLIEEVVSEHKLTDGITVCPDCHLTIDPYYRRKTHEN